MVPPTPIQWNMVRTAGPYDDLILSHSNFIALLEQSGTDVKDIMNINKQLNNRVD